MRDTKGLEFILTWRMLVVWVVAVVLSSALALLLIPQLSLRAAVQGGLIALFAMGVSRLVLWTWLKRRSR